MFQYDNKPYVHEHHQLNDYQGKHKPLYNYPPNPIDKNSETFSPDSYLAAW
ncbi:hypothetical protein AwEntero_31590 [Enterobacterales bacterium]|nr:hypothetical protein AwEntero_31590 [Enterobacterales bacterium]